jgi:3-hydroxyacyl-CoA dehydrogenase/enoyl-CoA hydratase/3-hydroxybutyryl-CoA epimerase
VLYESTHTRVSAEDGTATLWLDLPGHSPNRLGSDTFAEIEKAIAAVQANPFVDILVIRSAKPAGFSSGYDYGLLLDPVIDPVCLAAAGQRVLKTLAEASFISVALIDGSCLGAGLELALACDYRLAVATPTTQLGCVEVAHGFLPAWGGITRLTRLIGVRMALTMLLSGRIISGREAKEIGLVDDTFCTRRLKIELRTYLDTLQQSPHKPPRRRWDWFGTGKAIRDAQQTLANLNETEHPAPFAAIRVAQAALRSETDGLAAERREFAAVLRTPTAQAGLERLCEMERQPILHPLPIYPVAPIPTQVGFIGSDHPNLQLAGEIAIRGRSVVIDREIDLSEFWSDACRRLTPLEITQAANRVQFNPATEWWAGLDTAGWIVVCDAGMPLPVIEAQTRPRTILALVGQTIGPVQEIAGRPGRIAGLAYPVRADESNLVEVIAGRETTSHTLAVLSAWMRDLGFVPVVVSDRPQQVVRRVLAAVWDEAVRLVAEGVPVDAIDQAAMKAGFRTGPLETLDEIGLDSVHHLVPRVEPLLAVGLIGRSVGEGFYHTATDDVARPNLAAQLVLWDVRCRERAEPVVALDQATAAARDRLAYRAVNEAAAALGDESHAGPNEIDLAIALGANLFRPHGGPLRFADRLGLPRVVGRLHDLAKTFGRRFTPHPELIRRAAVGERFHDNDRIPDPDRSRAAA